MEDWEIKVSVLWLFIDIAYIVDVILGIMEPGGLQQFLNTGQIGGITMGPEVLFVLAIALLVPLVMAFLSLVLKNLVNRWTNVIVGAVYAFLWIIALITTVEQHPVAYSMLITLSKLVASAVIVWYAWKSEPKG
jgi:hypothetical protein